MDSNKRLSREFSSYEEFDNSGDSSCSEAEETGCGSKSNGIQKQVRSLIRQESQRALKYYGSVQRYSNRVSKQIKTGLNLSGIEVPSHDEIVEESKVLCKDYILQKIRKYGLCHTKLPPHTANPSETSDHVVLIGSELERLYPDLYRNISRQLNMTMSSEDIVKKIFMGVGEHLVKNEIHWGRVVALFAFAGGLAVDCLQQGHPEYVHKIIDFFGSFTAKFLVDWIAQQGGWSDIINCYKGTNDNSLIWALSGLGALVGFVATLLMTIQL